jgi:hypothetical protein
MLNTTQDAIKSMLKADPSLTPDDRTAILRAIRSHGKTTEPTPAAGGPQLVNRTQAAAMLGRSTRLIDMLARNGRLQRVKLTGATRGAGFRRADVCALIEGEARP